MDNPILIAIIAIFALILVIFLYMRSKNRAPTEAKASKRLAKIGKKSKRKKDTATDTVDKEIDKVSVPDSSVSAANPTPVDTTAQQSAQATPAPTTSQTDGDNIDIAQGYINEQRYDEAINELKHKLKSNPAHAKALLALLNVYAATKNRPEFDKVYSYVQAKADMLTLQEAKQLRDSIGYDTPAPSASNATASTANLTDIDDSAPTSEAQLDDSIFSLDDGISFDESPTSDSTATTNDATKASAPVESISIEDTQEDDAFDFSFDDEASTPPAQSDAVDPAANLNVADADISELDFDEVNVDQTLDEDDLFDLSLDDIDDNNEATTATTSSELDFDDSFGIETSQTSTQKATLDTAAIDANADDDFNFDIEKLADTDTKTDTTDLTADTSEALSFDLESDITAPVAKKESDETDDTLFDFDEDTKENTKANTKANTKTDTQKTVTLIHDDIGDNELSFDDIDTALDMDDASEAQSSVAPAPSQSDTLDFDFDLDLNTDTDTQTNASDNTATESTLDDAKNLEKVDTTEDLDDLTEIEDFDFGLEEDNKQPTSASLTPDPQPTESAPTDKEDADAFDFSDDFELDFSDEEPTSETKTKVLEDTQADTQISLADTQQQDEVVLDWDEPLEEKTTVIQPTDELPDNEFAIDDDFSLDTASVSDDANVASATPSTEADLSTDQTAVDANEADTPQAPAEYNAGLEDTLAQLDALSMDDFGSFDAEDTSASTTEDSTTSPALSNLPDATEQTPSAPADTDTKAVEVKQDTPVSSDVTEAAEATLQPEASSPITQKSTSSIDSEFMDTFGFVEELDKSQITLDLAEQYLELGEYDSAKRLINEVLNAHGDVTQKNKAKVMLERIS